MDVKGCAALVTGGASGLGLATARRLVEHGAHVVIVDRSDSAPDIARSIGAAFAKADVADEDQITAAVEQAAGLGPLRVLIGCAGISRAMRTVNRAGVPAAFGAFEFVVRVNLLGTFNCTRLAAAAMATTEPLDGGVRGVIVNTASIAAFDGQVGQVAYTAAKGGVTAMTLPLARDLASIGVRVNTIAPGLIDTPIYGTGDESDAFKAQLAASVVFPKRLGFADEFASLALEVVRNDYLNGEVIRIDGATRLPPK